MHWIHQKLRDKWNTVFHQGEDFNYIGLHLVRDRANHSIRVDMSGNVQKVLEQWGANIPESKIPASASILEQSGKPLDAAGKSQYMSLVMTLLYPARLCHLAILFPVTVLATRMQSPTADDLEHAFKIVGYLKTQVHGGFVLKGTPRSQMKVYADASHAIHLDAKGHGSMIVTLEDSPVAWRSHKISHVTTSSTETEISEVSEAITYIRWTRDFLEELRHPIVGATPIYEDNTSASLIMVKGGTFKRTKHIMVRTEFIRQHVRDGMIEFIHCPTDRQPADLMTKVHSEARIISLLLIILWTA